MKRTIIATIAALAGLAFGVGICQFIGWESDWRTSTQLRLGMALWGTFAAAFAAVAALEATRRKP